MERNEQGLSFCINLQHKCLVTLSSQIKACRNNVFVRAIVDTLSQQCRVDMPFLLCRQKSDFISLKRFCKFRAPCRDCRDLGPLATTALVFCSYCVLIRLLSPHASPDITFLYHSTTKKEISHVLSTRNYLTTVNLPAYFFSEMEQDSFSFSALRSCFLQIEPLRELVTSPFVLRFLMQTCLLFRPGRRCRRSGASRKAVFCHGVDHSLSSFQSRKLPLI